MNVSRRKVWTWALYDWANSAFATTVLAGFFPLFYGALTISEGGDAEDATIALGILSSISSLVVAVVSPLSGCIADSSHRQARFLRIFTLVGVFGTALLALVGGSTQAALGYGLGLIGFNVALAFYDGLLVSRVRKDDLHRASALGYGLGYLGGGLAFLICILIVANFEWLGLASTDSAVRLGFLLSSVWWLLFASPLLLERHEQRELPISAALVKASLKDLYHLIREIFAQPGLRWFMLAYWIYIDGVNTVMKMALQYGASIGLGSNDLVQALLLTQFIGFPCAIIFGILGTKFGARRSLYLALSVYFIATIGASFISKSWHFFCLAAVIGMVQGGVQSLSRSVFMQMIPADKSTGYCSVFNLVGRFASFLGPALIALVTVLSGSTRMGISSIVVLFVLGAFFLAKSPSRQSV